MPARVPREPRTERGNPAVAGRNAVLGRGSSVRRGGTPKRSTFNFQPQKSVNGH